MLPHGCRRRTFLGRFDWYTPRSQAQPGHLSAVERKKVELIQEYEAMATQPAGASLTASVLVGVWHQAPRVAAGWQDRFFLDMVGRSRFATNQMDGTQRLKSASGTWELQGVYANPDNATDQAAQRGRVRSGRRACTGWRPGSSRRSSPAGRSLPAPCG